LKEYKPSPFNFSFGETSEWRIVNSVSYKIKTMRKIIITILTTLLLMSAALADRQGLIEVKSQVDTSVITIGDLITYSIIINRDKHLRVEKPGEGLNLGMFEIKRYNFHKPIEKNGRIIERYDFTISVYDTGKYEIPPFPVAYFANDTTHKYNIIEAPAIKIYVKSVISGDEAKVLKDIKPPIAIPFNWKFWLSMAAILLLLLVAAYLGYRLWKKRQEKGYLFIPPPPPRPAHEVALEALQKLFTSDLLQRGGFKAFFSEFSDIMRNYLEGRYFVSALEETTLEIVGDMVLHLADEALLKKLQKMLSLADLVKFAKYLPAEEETEKIKTDALDFIEQTKIVFTPEEKEEEKQLAEADGSEKLSPLKGR